MTEKDQIKELFAKGLQDHQVQVDPALWTSISSSIGAGAAKTGLGLFAKTLIGVAATAVVVGTVYLSFETKSQEVKKRVVQTPQETSKSKEDKKITPTAPTKPTFQTLHYDPPALGCFEINDELFIPDFDALYSSGAPIEESSLTSGIEPQAVTEVISAQAQVVQPIIAPAQVETQQAVQAKKPTRLSLPNIFTPNGDGQNETLQIQWGNTAVEDFSLVVLDAKNNVVFKSDRPDFNWDGTDLGGEKLPRAHYIYFVSALLDGQKWQQSSSLQIQY